jgi:type III secretion protein N (ATPase)
MSDEPKRAPDLSRYLAKLKDEPPARLQGRVKSLTGLVLRAAAPGASVGQLVTLQTSQGRTLRAQVVGFGEEDAVLLPLGELDGVGPDCAITSLGAPLSVPCGDKLLGRVLDGLGDPLDGLPPLEGSDLAARWPVERPPPSPLRRPKIARPFATGLRAIDGLMTLAEGQRVGLFAGSGVGKSTLLAQLARGAEADVAVICLVGERGRELVEFLDDALKDALARSVVVCATSDAPCLVRRNAPFVATSIAEWFRGQGKRVLLLMDSISRLARAQREVGLAAGEPPVRRGYPPSVFGMLPRLVERAGLDERGSITAVYTVLTDADEMDDPIADELRGLLDGHWVLSRARAEQAKWPALDVSRSLSRSMPRVVSPQHLKAAERLRRAVALVEQRRDLLALGGYKRGADRELDDALSAQPDIESFLGQGPDERAPMEQTVARLVKLFG